MCAPSGPTEWHLELMSSSGLCPAISCLADVAGAVVDVSGERCGGGIIVEGPGSGVVGLFRQDVCM